MENYSERIAQPSLYTVTKPVRKAHPVSNERVLQTVMPLHQIIRFANQAKEKNQSVRINVEYALPNGKFTQVQYEGYFRSTVNSKKQVAFCSAHNRMLHLFSIEQILAIILN